MVDFRYHLVSIVAVFLALGTGLILGSTVIDRAVVDDLESRIKPLTREKDALRSEVEDLRELVRDETRLIDAVLPAVVAGKLAGQRVLVVSAPQVSGELRDDVVSVLETAGATITARVRLLPKLARPADAAEIEDLVARLVPAGVTVDQPTVAGRVAAVLGAVLTTASAENPPAATRDVISVLAGLDDAGVIDVDASAPRPASLVVLLTGAPAQPEGREDAARDNAQIVDAVDRVVDGFARSAAGVLVSAPRDGVAPGTVIHRVRTDATRATRIATVDGIDASPWRIAAVLALADLARGEAGHYGSGAGAERQAPSISPSP